MEDLPLTHSSLCAVEGTSCPCSVSHTNQTLSNTACGHTKFFVSIANLSECQLLTICSSLVPCRYIKPTETLEANKLKDGANILVMKAGGSNPALVPAAAPPQPADALAAQKKEEEVRVQRVLEAAEALAKRDDDGSGEKYFLELTDQNGNPFPIGGDDRHSLLLGLALHEKGRKQLKTDDYEHALEFFLAADKAFDRVNPKIVEAIDNPGFLSLDIAWCYFRMQRMELLQDAAWRLQKSSQFFDQSYGPMQERLITLKGGSCPEMVVYVRLYLLEAIVSYHSGNRERAANFVIMCEQKLNDMMLDEKDIHSMLELGFEPKESRIALRAANKVVTNAIEYAMNARDVIKQRQEAEALRRQERRTQRQYGRTADGGWIDTQLLESLVEMGFERGLVAEALKQTNNVQHAALSLLTDSSDLLRDVASNSYKPSEELVDSVVGFGFPAGDARKALRIMLGDTQRAINYLLYKSGVDVDGAEEFATIEATIEMEQDAAGGLSDDESADGSDDEDRAAAVEGTQFFSEEEIKKQEELRDAEYDLVQDIPEDPDAHLDFTLDDEAKILAQYKSYLV